MNEDSRNSKERVLIATVGTGNRDKLESTLLVPMRKSIKTDDWTTVVLLPSSETKSNAEILQREFGEKILVRALNEPKSENDVDGCFAHFDDVLEEIIRDGCKSDSITIDFTRGTKAMSAALVLSAIGRDVPILRYVHSDQRDERGAAVSGAEKPTDFSTIRAMSRRNLDLMKKFLRKGNFEAANEIISENSLEDWPKKYHIEALKLQALAHVYAAWDRLDYARAKCLVDENWGKLKDIQYPFEVSAETRCWIRTLAKSPKDGKDFKEMANWLRIVACDLLANAERRVKGGHFEDALLRYYRILELLGQIRLFDNGYDSSCIQANDPKVIKFREKLMKSKSHDFGKNNNETLTAPRELSARFLGFLEDHLSKELQDFDRNHDMKTSGRNLSILIHGFSAKAPSVSCALEKINTDLENLLMKDDPCAERRLVLARTLSFDN